MSVTFKLPSGPECVSNAMLGKHQRILTEQKKKGWGDSLEEMLVDVIQTVGGVKVDKDFIRGMLVCDKKAALAKIRSYSLDDPDEFIFKYKYIDRDQREQVFEQVLSMKEGFPVTHPKVKTDTKTDTWVDMDFVSYAEVLKAKKVKTTLPKSKTLVEITMLDGQGELIGSGTKKEEKSSHTPIMMRRPTKFSDTGTPIQLNLDTLHLADIEHLRGFIKEVEGRVDTEIMFEHPEAQYLPPDEQKVIVELMGEPVFFFPSGAI